jgi:hypothetical protein
MEPRRPVTGTWNGIYFYDHLPFPGHEDGVNFVLNLQQNFWDRFIRRFRGTVEDGKEGMPGVGQVRGAFSSKKLRFWKFMPEMYVMSMDGPQTLRDYFESNGYDVTKKYSHRPILYEGTFSDADHASGTWTLSSNVLRLNTKQFFRILKGTGTWKAVRMQS